MRVARVPIVDAVVFLLVTGVFAVLAVRIGMMLAPLIGRMSPDAGPGDAAETRDAPADGDGTRDDGPTKEPG